MKREVNALFICKPPINQGFKGFRIIKKVVFDTTYENAKASVMESMQKLQVDYLDLCLLHQPFGDSYGAYRALEDLYDEGKIRAIGISNFYTDRMVDFASFNRIKPMVNQVEMHPHNQQKEAKVWHDKYGVQMEAWAPFGEGRGGMFELPELKAIAEKYGKSVAQVILRWHLQRGMVCKEGRGTQTAARLYERQEKLVMSRRIYMNRK